MHPLHTRAISRFHAAHGGSVAAYGSFVTALLGLRVVVLGRLCETAAPGV